MEYKLLEEHPRTYVLVFNTGDDLAAGLAEFATERKMTGSSFKAIGALSRVKLGWFNWETKKYQTAVDLDEQVELLSLIGDIAEKDGKPQVHAHAVVGRQDGTAHGGHLQAATVRPTCEVVLVESPQHMLKQVDPASGIALIRL
jgi:predicted DNA-binding protein with PD1-like motif